MSAGAFIHIIIGMFAGKIFTQVSSPGSMHDPIDLPHLEARTADSNSHHFLIEGKDDLT